MPERSESDSRKLLRRLRDVLATPAQGQDRLDQIIRVMRQMGMDVGRSFYPVRCDDPLTYVELVRAGCGLGGILRAVGDPDPALVRAIDTALATIGRNGAVDDRRLALLALTSLRRNIAPDVPLSPRRDRENSAAA